MVVKHHHRALWLCLFLLWRIRELGVLFAGPGRVTRDTPGIGRWLQVLESVQGAFAFLSETLKKNLRFCWQNACKKPTFLAVESSWIFYPNLISYKFGVLNLTSSTLIDVEQLRPLPQDTW